MSGGTSAETHGLRYGEQGRYALGVEDGLSEPPPPPAAITFTDVAADVGLKHAWLPMGANFGDLDNDGWLDIYLATGDPDYQTLMPNVALRNAGGTRFQNVTTSTGLGHLQKGHGVAFADFDEDGDQDIYHQLGGFYPGDKFQNLKRIRHIDEPLLVIHGEIDRTIAIGDARRLDGHRGVGPERPGQRQHGERKHARRTAASRAALRLRMWAAVGIRTLPPRWPHFFSEASWSSKWTPAAPASI